MAIRISHMKYLHGAKVSKIEQNAVIVFIAETLRKEGISIHIRVVGD